SKKTKSTFKKTHHSSQHFKQRKSAKIRRHLKSLLLRLKDQDNGIFFSKFLSEILCFTKFRYWSSKKYGASSRNKTCFFKSDNWLKITIMKEVIILEVNDGRKSHLVQDFLKSKKID